MTRIVEVPPELEVVHVTPEMAAEWLEKRNEGNRKIGRTVVKQYADAMAEGRWRLTHQSIAFDDEGTLLDGQHRLAAVVRAGVTVSFTVQRGWGRETFAVLDTGYKRAAYHFVNSPNANTIAATAGILGGSLGLWGPPNPWTKRSTEETLRVVDDWPEITEQMPAALQLYRETRISASVHCAVLAQAKRTPYAAQTDEWLEGLLTGVDLTVRDPRRLLRQRWVKEAGFLNSSPGRKTAYTLIVKAWNAFATGSDVGQLRSRGDEALPWVAGLSRDGGK